MKTSLLAAALAVTSTAAAALCSEDRVTVIGDFGHAPFTVTVADDDQERARGLMDVAEMPTMSGMLFVYDAPQHATFLDAQYVDRVGHGVCWPRRDDSGHS